MCSSGPRGSSRALPDHSRSTGRTWTRAAGAGTCRTAAPHRALDSLRVLRSRPMLTTLETAYTDTRAGDLAWCLGKDALPALAVLGVRIGETRGLRADVELRLLGASHQVLVDAGQGGC